MRALLSVSDKTGLTELAEALAARHFELISTGGTAAALGAAGLRVWTVSDVTGFPEMMDGRVKTLHPKIHGGILARRGAAPDLAAAAAHAIPLIDLVVVNLYPFERTAADPDAGFDALFEQIDIGGPSLVRAAAKNFRDVLVVVDTADYPFVVRELDRPGGPALEFRFELACKAFAHTARYDAAIARTLAAVRVEDGRFTRGHPPPAPIFDDLRKIADLRYGENPHQRAAWFGAAEAGIGFSSATVLQGKALSYTNLLDLDAALRIVMEFEEPTAVIIKHTNPCGAATGRSAADAYVCAREADDLAAFGGVAGLNRSIDEDAANAITSTFMEAVIAPAVEPSARPLLARKPNLRVVVVDMARAAPARTASPREQRSILGALLVQDADAVEEARAPWPSGEERLLRVVTRRSPSPKEWTALRFAWRIAAHVKSNAVVFADDAATLTIGAGQMSRVDAVRVAVMKAQARSRVLEGSVAASDAFFPFRDGVDAVAAAGATAIVQPGGSVRDEEVIAAADEHDLAMVFTGKRHFRH